LCVAAVALVVALVAAVVALVVVLVAAVVALVPRVTRYLELEWSNGILTVMLRS
jgi:hypothetical protein